MRYNRDFELTIQTELARAIVVRPPFNIVFNADKSTDKSLNKMNIKVYGLSSQNQLAIVKNSQEEKNFEIELKVGYQNNIESIFRGYVNIGERSREGANLPIVMECIDGGFDAKFSFTSKTVKGKSAVDAILEDMNNTRRGKITQLQSLIRPRVLVGNSWDLIKQQINDEQYFIDNGQLNILKADEVISSFIPVVQASTGLISTPTREETKVTFQTMMNPALKIGGLCQINSVYATDLNGIYKINVIGYDGEYEGSAWTQTVTCELTKDYIVL